jgi:hypothetical protein
MNVGNGPAIELEVSLIVEKINAIRSVRESFLRAGEQWEINYINDDLIQLGESTYHLLCEYRCISIDKLGQISYQTWLPFKISMASREGEIYVAPGELEFREVAEEDRVDAFSSGSKPR